MSIWMIGVDHNRAGIDIRSLFSFTKKRMAEAYSYFQGFPEISGNVILSTCNRMEWWLSVSEGADFSPLEYLCGFLQVEPERYAGFFTQRRNADAVDHFFRLAAGLESQIVGEDQILTQVGDALQTARAAYASDHTLEVLFRQGVTAGKRVKTETRLSSADRSVIHAALDALETGGYSLSGRKCMVIGNGMMGKLSAVALMERGAEVTVTVRQYHSGIVDIPRGCRCIGYTDRYALLPSCDLVVSATSSPNYTIRRTDLESLPSDHDIILVDLAVPRDIEPECASLSGFTLYDVDSFRIDLKNEAFLQNAAKAEAILDEVKRDFYIWYEGRDLVPRIAGLKNRAARDVSARLTQVYKGVSLPQGEKERFRSEVEDATRRMLNHLLFGLRGKLSERELEDCLRAMEEIYPEQG